MYGAFAMFWVPGTSRSSRHSCPARSKARPPRGWVTTSLPWGIGGGFLSLLFTVPFCRHETDRTYRKAASSTLLVGIGGGPRHRERGIGYLPARNSSPDPGSHWRFSGWGYICAYLGQVDTSDGIGYSVAFALGILGAAIALYAIGRAGLPDTPVRRPGSVAEAERFARLAGRRRSGCSRAWRSSCPRSLRCWAASRSGCGATGTIVGLIGAGWLVATLRTPGHHRTEAVPGARAGCS